MATSRWQWMRLYFVIIRMRFQSGTLLRSTRENHSVSRVVIKLPWSLPGVFYVELSACKRIWLQNIKRASTFTSLYDVWTNIQNLIKVAGHEGRVTLSCTFREYIDSTVLPCNTMQQWYLWFWNILPNSLHAIVRFYLFMSINGDWLVGYNFCKLTWVICDHRLKTMMLKPMFVIAILNKKYASGGHWWSNLSLVHVCGEEGLNSSHRA